LPTWSVSALLTALAVGIFAVPSLATVLEFDREQPWDCWRVLTGHFTHFDLRHLFWDGIMFLVLGALIEKRGRGRLVGCLVVSAVAIPLAVALWMPEIPTYRGLSGIDSALFTLAMGLLLREALAEKRGGQVILFGALALGFVGKVIYEFLTGHTFFVDSSSFTPLPLAHVVGAVIGLGFVVGKTDPGSVLSPRPWGRKSRSTATSSSSGCCSYSPFPAGSPSGP
jgi:rhomboid family GlyGly-CTERM serine protease